MGMYQSGGCWGNGGGETPGFRRFVSNALASGVPEVAEGKEKQINVDNRNSIMHIALNKVFIVHNGHTLQIFVHFCGLKIAAVNLHKIENIG